MHFQRFKLLSVKTARENPGLFTESSSYRSHLLKNTFLQLSAFIIVFTARKQHIKNIASILIVGVAPCIKALIQNRQIRLRIGNNVSCLLIDIIHKGA